MNNFVVSEHPRQRSCALGNFPSGRIDSYGQPVYNTGIIERYLTTGVVPGLENKWGINRDITLYEGYWNLCQCAEYNAHIASFMTNYGLLESGFMPVVGTNTTHPTIPVIFGLRESLYVRLAAMPNNRRFMKSGIQFVGRVINNRNVFTWSFVPDVEVPETLEDIIYNTDIVIFEYALENHWNTLSYSRSKDSIMAKLYKSIIIKSHLAVPMHTYTIANLLPDLWVHQFVSDGHLNHEYLAIIPSKRHYFEMLRNSMSKWFKDIDNCDLIDLLENMRELMRRIKFAFLDCFGETLSDNDIMVFRSFPDKQTENGPKASFHIIVNSEKRFKDIGSVQAILLKYGMLNGCKSDLKLKGDSKVYKSSGQKFRILASGKSPSDAVRREFLPVGLDFTTPIDIPVYLRERGLKFTDTFVTPHYTGEIYSNEKFSQYHPDNTKFDEPSLSNEEFAEIVKCMGMTDVWDYLLKTGGFDDSSLQDDEVAFPHAHDIRTQIHVGRDIIDVNRMGISVPEDADYAGPEDEEIIVKMSRWLDSSDRRSLFQRAKRAENSKRMFYLLTAFMEVLTRKNYNHGTLLSGRDDPDMTLESDPTDIVGLWRDAQPNIGPQPYDYTKLCRWLNATWYNGVSVGFNGESFSFKAAIIQKPASGRYLPHHFEYNRYYGAIVSAMVESLDTKLDNIIVNILVYSDVPKQCTIKVYPANSGQTSDANPIGEPLLVRMLDANQTVRLNLCYYRLLGDLDTDEVIHAAAKALPDDCDAELNITDNIGQLVNFIVTIKVEEETSNKFTISEARALKKLEQDYDKLAEQISRIRLDSANRTRPAEPEPDDVVTLINPPEPSVSRPHSPLL